MANQNGLVSARPMLQLPFDARNPQTSAPTGADVCIWRDKTVFGEWKDQEVGDQVAPIGPPRLYVANADSPELFRTTRCF
jgi:hypothetical protein